MEITKEVLEKIGFYTNHPEYVLAKYKMHGKTDGEWFIGLEQEYKPLSNKLGWNMISWKESEHGVIEKRCQCSFVDTLEELKLFVEFCHIDNVVKKIEEWLEKN